MHAELQIRLPVRLRTLVASAAMLERLEHNPRTASPEQYRALVKQVTQMLDAATGDDALPTLLGAFPATADLYENLHYAAAGLCRSPLPQAVDAEVGAQSILERMRNH